MTTTHFCSCSYKKCGEHHVASTHCGNVATVRVRVDVAADEGYTLYRCKKCFYELLQIDEKAVMQ